jgi:hypothetical protein
MSRAGGIPFHFCGFLAFKISSSCATRDQTYLRGIQHVDAGPRHAPSFVLCDQLQIA